ncbi:DUF4062 domain-containing protein [Hathewaya histolytica]|nr:DUF4062 domain-containing protein [Hathewaya histolytica]
MEKRYQVFISSTFVDLKEEREEVMKAILSLDCFPAGMELFPASNQSQFDYIKRIIDKSDYYILIIAGRYGTEDTDCIGFTEKEYDYARSKGIPVYSFIYKNIDRIERGKTDKSEVKLKKLKSFIEKVSKDKMCSYWENKDQLSNGVEKSLRKGFKDDPRNGWIKGHLSNINNDIENIKKENEKLQKLVQELKAKISEDEFSDVLIKGDRSIIIFYDVIRKDTSKLSGKSIKLTWNILFKNLQGYFYDYVEFDMSKSSIEHMLSKYLESDELTQIKIHTDDFNKIIYYFEELGLLNIMESEFESYVKISDKGKKYYKQLCIHKK